MLQENSTAWEDPDSEETNQTMTWTEAGQLSRRGVCFGAHTMTHAILTQVGSDTASQEIRQSRPEIEEHLGQSCHWFAYPNGNYTPDVRELVKESGFRFAFTTGPGIWTADTDPLLIPRVNISENHLVGPGGRFSAAVFQYCTFWRCRSL